MMSSTTGTHLRSRTRIVPATETLESFAVTETGVLFMNSETLVSGLTAVSTARNRSVRVTMPRSLPASPTTQQNSRSLPLNFLTASRNVSDGESFSWTGFMKLARGSDSSML